MTNKKAFKIVEMLLEKKTALKRDLQKPENNWGNDIAWSMVQTHLISLTNEIDWLLILKEELNTNCKNVRHSQKY